MGMLTKCDKCKSNIEYIVTDVSIGYPALSYMPIYSIKCPKCGKQITVPNPMHERFKLNI